MELFEYQRKAVDFIKNKKRCGIFYEMGLGKTIIALTAIAEIKPKQTLVVAPKAVAVNVWADEAKKWEHTKHLTTGLFLGSKDLRLKTLRENPDIIICGVENVKFLPEKRKFDMIIVDESAKFKNSNTQRFKDFSQFPPLADYVVIMTGTPISESLIDIWSQMYLVDGGARLDKQKMVFLRKYFNPYVAYGLNGTFTKHEEKPNGKQEVAKKISDIVLMGKLKDHAELKGAISRVYNVHMNDKAIKNYKSMVKNWALLDKNEITVPNAAAKINKLMQICNGFIYNDDHETIPLHTSKLDMLEELIEETEDNVLVVTRFKEDERAIKGRFSFAEAFSVDNLKRWNERGIKLMYINPKTAGHGINFQHGGSTIIWYGLTYSLAEYEQTNARLIRRGQEDVVKILHLITPSTVEEEIIKRLGKKEDCKGQLIELLKYESEERLNERR